MPPLPLLIFFILIQKFERNSSSYFYVYFLILTRRGDDLVAASIEIVARVALNSDESARKLRERQRCMAQAAAHNQFSPIFGCHQCDSAAYELA